MPEAASRRWPVRLLRRAGVAFIVAMAVHATGALEFAERRLLDIRFGLAGSEPSGRRLLVEIDRRSLDEIGVWPWPRSLHALALSRLDAAGAAEIAFDIDFSARSTPEEDGRFARALERARASVLLAAFRDPAGGGDVLAIEPFRAHATLASVEMNAEADGRIWRAAPGRDMRIGRLLSMFGALAGAESEGAPWWIDYGIDPEGLPVLSFADVAAGRFDPEAVRGRQVLIGATAVELGDIVATPRFGLLPGPVVQLLAAESAASGRRLARAHPAATALFTALVALFAAAGLRRPVFARVAFSLCGSAAATFAFAVALQRMAPVLLDVTPAFLAALLAAPIAYAGRMAQLDLAMLAQGLALARANRFMARVADNLDDGLVTLGPDGAVCTLNPAARSIFGLGPDADIASVDPAQRVVWPRFPGREALPRALTAMMGGSGRRLICARGAGERFYAEATVTSLSEPDGRIWIVLIRDVTRTVLAERAARRREALLRDLKMKAEAATRTKTEFVAAMSHELRTPLNAIIGFSSIMEEEALGPLGADGYRKMAVETKNSGSRLLRLLTHILDYANAEMDRLEIAPESLDLAALARDSVALQAARAARAGITVRIVEPATPVILPLDRAGVQKAIGNLLNNALRFAPPGSAATVTVARRPGGGVVVIQDEGPGMAQDFLARCFEPFEQAETGASRGFEGAGLGLTVARAFVERHGGRLDLASAPGEGVTATLFLPEAAGAGAMAAE